MPSYPSIRTALDKRKIASGDTYLILMEISILDPTSGEVQETVYVANNNDPDGYVWNGNTYQSLPMTVDIKQSSTEVPSCTVTVFDLGNTIQGLLQNYTAPIGWPAKFYVINTADANPAADMEYEFFVNGATANAQDYSIEFTVSAENPLTLSYPARTQYKNKCFWTFKDTNCRYQDGGYKTCGVSTDVTLDTTCDNSLDGPKGCRAHCNVLNYGGFPGINDNGTQLYVEY